MKVPKKHEELFKVLILEESEAGFVVCIVPLVISILVFAFEWFIRAKDLLVHHLIFVSFHKMKTEKLERKAKTSHELLVK